MSEQIAEQLDEGREFMTGHPHLIDFDGHRFPANYYDVEHYAMLYIARKARGGDQDAAEFLNAFKIRVLDAEGKVYWPKGE